MKNENFTEIEIAEINRAKASAEYSEGRKVGEDEFLKMATDAGGVSRMSDSELTRHMREIGRDLIKKKRKAIMSVVA